MNHWKPSLKGIPLYPTIFFLICMVCMTLQMGFFMHYTVIVSRGLICCSLISVADALIILSPYFFLSPRWRWTALIPSLALTVFLISNSIFFKIFSDLIYLSDYFKIGAYNPFTFSSGLEEWSVLEWIYLILGLIPSCGYFILHKKIATDKYSNIFRWSSLGAIILLALSQQVYLSFLRRNALSIDNIKDHLNYNYHQSRITDYRLLSLTRYITYQSFWILTSRHFITEAERRDADSFTTSQRTAFLTLPPLYDLTQNDLPEGISGALTEEASNKNLILIVVESLGSTILTNDFGGITPMPFLRSLMESDSALTFTNVEKFTYLGRSNDGNFVYETGLIPLDYKNTLFEYPTSDYPSLAKAFKRNSAEIIADEPYNLYHRQTNESYGYDTLISSDSYHKGVGKSMYDKILFDKAAVEIDRLRSPFYCKIVTVGMHQPFKFYEDFAPLPPNSLSHEGDINYIQRALATDLALKDFFEYLNDKGILQKSIVVIASDHEPYEYELNETFSPNIVMMIVNSGFRGHTDAKARQIDLYPTLLDIFNRRDYKWPGAGRSLLRNPYQPDDTERGRKVSDIMITGKYFGK